jgi:signal transduction histidine kinase
MLETLKTGQGAHVIFEHPTEDGHWSYSDLITFPVKDTQGNIHQIIEIWRDITKKLAPTWEKRMDRMKSDINKLVQEDRMISLGKLVASCVHEINNPIQGLLTFSYVIKHTLEEGAPSAETLGEIARHIDIMCSELERCGQIVSGLLSFSRDASQKFLPTDLNEVIRSTITLTHHKMELQNIHLSLELSREPLIVNGSSGRLEQCFLNLIFNAIEAMPDGGGLWIESRQGEAGRQAVVRIKDQGCGIPDGQQGNIFDPFYTTKEPGEGTGLGLSIVYGVVKNHGGIIRVESEPDDGCLFELSFPIHRP